VLKASLFLESEMVKLIGHVPETKRGPFRRNTMEAKVMETRQERHERHLRTMRAYLAGGENFLAAKALQFAKNLMTGLRKDGETPAFHHPLSVARYLRAHRRSLIYGEETIAAAFLHDILEDFGDTVTREQLRDLFGERVATAVWALSKKSNGTSKTPDTYFMGIASNEIASVVKAVDRLHNLHTMEGVFSVEKQLDYIKEARDRFIPMLIEAGDRFPEQFDVYENLKMNLRLQTIPMERLCEALMRLKDEVRSGDCRG
jgi:(p)ppGpp synthase/HD superfamily hydrolase